MSTPYSSDYSPPAPAFNIRLAAPQGLPQFNSVVAIIDTGSDGTLIPTNLLEQVEAIDIGSAILHGVLGESREVHLYEVDLHVESLMIPSITAIGDDFGSEIILGRNVLNKLILLLDGQHTKTDLFEQRSQVR
jgi:hypothetical protein